MTTNTSNTKSTQTIKPSKGRKLQLRSAIRAGASCKNCPCRQCGE